jgi:hypothetical protein
VDRPVGRQAGLAGLVDRQLQKDVVGVTGRAWPPQ